MIYENQKIYKKLSELLLLVCVLLLFFTYITENINIDRVKETTNKFLTNTLILEVERNDGSVAKGTAFILSNDAVISVAHLFEDDDITITGYLYDKKQAYELDLVKKDTDLDVALLSLVSFDAKIQKVLFGSVKDINYADSIIKIGNAFGYGLSVDAGIVSAPLAHLEIGGVIREVINISIDIHSGDSGGPVLNTNGVFVGLISFRTNSGFGNDGLSFIVPSYVIYDFLQ